MKRYDQKGKGQADVFLPDDFSWKELKEKLYQKNWNVYAKSLLSGPDRVIEYLGRYTHRVAISNSRILSMENDQITFKIKDYRTDNYTSTLKLPVVEFIRRFFQHVLPGGFYKIRYFGFLSLSTAKELVGLVFELLEKSWFLPRFEGLNGMEIYEEISGKRQWLCPVLQVRHHVSLSSKLFFRLIIVRRLCSLPYLIIKRYLT